MAAAGGVKAEARTDSSERTIALARINLQLSPCCAGRLHSFWCR
jgi:hypothetical protein